MNVIRKFRIFCAGLTVGSITGIYNLSKLEEDYTKTRDEYKELLNILNQDKVANKNDDAVLKIFYNSYKEYFLDLSLAIIKLVNDEKAKDRIDLYFRNLLKRDNKKI
jgi:hypothetical protein